MIITGKVFAGKAYGVRVYSHAGNLGKQIDHDLNLEPDSTFVIRFYLAEPTEVMFNSMQVFCQPGDSVHVIIKGEGGSRNMEFSGINSGGYNYLSKILRIIRSEPVKGLKDNITPGSDHFFQFKMRLDEDLKRKLSIYRAYCNYERPTKQFRDYAYAKLYFTYLSVLTSKVLYAQDANEKVSASLLRKLKPSTLQNDAHAKINEYWIVLSGLIENFWLNSKNTNDDVFAFNKKIQYTQAMFTGRTRDVLLARFFSEYFDVGNPALYSVLDSTYSKPNLFSDTTYISALKPLYDQYTSYKRDWGKDLTPLIDVSDNKKSLGELIYANKGNVIYVDLWASWCSPCIAEFPNSKILADRYKGRNIKYIYLSTDDDKNSWKKAHDKLSLDNNSSYLIDLQEFENFKKRINLKTIPRYLIFDKEGSLIDGNAVRPGDPKLIGIINKLLEQ